MKICKPRNAWNRVLYFVRWQLWVVLLALPEHAAFVLRGVRAQRTGIVQRAALATKLLWIHLRVPCAHAPSELLAIIEEILSLPPALPGAIVECGCYQGGSTAKLSLAAGLANRDLIVCDSFEGLPAPETADTVDRHEAFEAGDFAFRLEHVEGNVRRFGNPTVTRYVRGWYHESLAQLSSVKIACVFLDVDLQESIKSCLVALWKCVAPGSKVFVHDVDRPPVIKPFQDEAWWATHINAPVPKFVGGGCGLGWQKGLLGYAVKAKF